MGKIRQFMISSSKGFCAALFLATSLSVFYFSSDSRIQVLSCTGNYYYSSREIYQRTGINDTFRIWIPGFLLENRLEKDPLIESATITKKGQTLDINIQEKLVLGYYVQDDENYIFTSDGQSIPIEGVSSMRSLIHFPFLADLSEEQLDLIAKEFQNYPDYLTRDVLEKIAEIRSWPESYDPNMVKMVMQDGNLVFTSIDSLHMISNYQAMLTKLEGEDVCLLLDGDNHTIDKIACDFMLQTPEEKEATREAILKDYENSMQALEEAKEQQEKAEKEKKEAEKEKAESQKQKEPAESDAPDTSQNESPAEPGETMENQSPSAGN